MTDIRQQRGLEIAAIAQIKKQGEWYIVPSQTSSPSTRYKVKFGPHAGDCHCNCPDHELRGIRRKHLYAVEYAIKRERNADGSTTVTESVTIKSTKRTTYPQNWPAYNAAQTNEKAQFQMLLHELCKGIGELRVSNEVRKGRPRMPLADAIISVTFKIYSTVSGRRFISDLCDTQGKGYIDRVPHFNSIFNYLENPELTLLVLELITASSLPLKSIECDFAVDSTGFTTSRFTCWYDHK